MSPAQSHDVWKADGRRYIRVECVFVYGKGDHKMNGRCKKYILISVHNIPRYIITLLTNIDSDPNTGVWRWVAGEPIHWASELIVI